MKNYILAIATAMAFLFASCSSETPIIDSIIENSQTETYKATFTLDGLTAESGAFNLRSVSLTDVNIKYLEYWIFKTADINNITWQMNYAPVLRDTVADYNKAITLELPKGDYTIVLFATDSDETISSTSKAEVSVVGEKYQMYAAKKQFIIDDQNKTVNEKISLDRKVGKVEFIIEDLSKLPADVQSISILGTSRSRISAIPGLLFSIGTANLAVEGTLAKRNNSILTTIPRSDFSKYNKDNPISAYVYPNGSVYYLDTYTPISVSDIYIQGSKDGKFYDLDMGESFTDQNSNVLFMRKVGRYSNIKANQVTRFTGKIGNLNNTDFGVEFIEEWNTLTVPSDK